MKHLLEIARIITKKKIRKIEILDDQVLDRHTKFAQFYEALAAERFKNDRDAAQALYGCKPQDTRYRQLKSRFRRRMLNTLFFIDVNKPTTSHFDRAQFTSHKDWALIKILQENNAHQSAVSLAKSVLSTALKFHLTDIAFQCARLLREYAAEEGDAHGFEQYSTLFRQQSELYQAECQAEEIYQHVLLAFHRPRNEDGDLPIRIERYCDTLLRLSEAFESPGINYCMFMVWTMRYEMAREYGAMLEVTRQMERYFDTYSDFFQEEMLIAIYTRQMSAYLQFRDYQNGQVNAEKCLQRFKEGSAPWFAFMEYYLLLAMHTGYFIQGLAIYNRAVNSSRMRKLDPVSREKWRLFEAFLHYALPQPRFRAMINPLKKQQPFLPAEFIDKPVDHPGELRIFTVLTHILQTLFAIENNQLHQAEQLLDTLNYLANRRLPGPEYARPVQFIRLLQRLRRAKFQPDEIRLSKKYLQKLEETPFTYRGIPGRLEVIPYDTLWEMALNRLG
jgi:hypothetical protein